MSLRPPIGAINFQGYMAGRMGENRRYSGSRTNNNYYELQKQQEILRVAAILKKLRKK